MKPSPLLWLRLLAVLLAFALFPGRVLAAAEREIDQVEEARYDAMIHADAAALDRILADEHTYNQPNGNVASKASFIALITSGEVQIKKAERYGVTIHIYGDLATATGSTRVDLESKGEARQVDLRYLNVWVKRDGRWQLVIRQSAFKPK